MIYLNSMRNQKGVTFVELIMVIVMIGAMSIATLSFITYCQGYVSKAKQRFIAVNFAQETMEGLYWQSCDYANNNALPAVGPIDAPLPDDVNFGQLRNQYGGTRNYAIADSVDANGNLLYKLITVNVNWN